MMVRALVVSAIAAIVGCGSEAPFKGGPYFDSDSSDADGIGDGLGDGDSLPSDDDGDQGSADGDGSPADNDPPTTLGTIHDIKTGVIAVGDQVSLENVIVVAVGPQGAFVQTADSGLTEYDGIYLYQPVGDLAVGDIINVDTCLVQEFSGEIQLLQPVTQVMSPSSGVPAPLVVATADIAVGGSKAVKLEGMLVQVQDVTVASTNGVTGEFDVEDGLTVDDFFYPATTPALGTAYTSITGVLRAAASDSKLTPRDGSDFVLAP